MIRCRWFAVLAKHAAIPKAKPQALAFTGFVGMYTFDILRQKAKELFHVCCMLVSTFRSKDIVPCQLSGRALHQSFNKRYISF